MEKTVCKYRSLYILALILLASCILFFVSYGLFVNSSAQLSENEIGVGHVIYSLYAYGGFIVICLVAIAVISFLRGKYKSVVSRVFIWAALLLSYHYASAFFANAFNLALLGFRQGLIYSAEYLPSLLLTIVLIAVICQWNSENKKAAYMISWACLIISGFLSGWFIFYKITGRVSDDSIIIHDMFFGIMQAVVIPVAIAFVFNCCRKKELFDRAFKD